VVNRNNGGKVVPIGGTSLGSLGEHERLHAYCRRCKRYRSLDVPALLDRHGDLHLRALQRRLQCIRCGARKAELIRATALPW
jgi:ribosomal protein L37E